MMKIRTLILMPLIWLVIGTNSNPGMTKVADLQYQRMGVPTVYQKFQPRLSGYFTITTQSKVFSKVPGVTLILQHTYPVLCELHFEAVCRVSETGVAFRLEFLYNDHTLEENKFYKNDGFNHGSGRSWFFGPTHYSHHFICSRSETVYLAAGTHAIDVGVSVDYYQPAQIYGGQLTVKMTPYDSTQKVVGNLPMLHLPNRRSFHQ
jgi:hypothetical protein